MRSLGLVYCRNRSLLTPLLAAKLVIGLNSACFLVEWDCGSDVNAIKICCIYFNAEDCEISLFSRERSSVFVVLQLTPSVLTSLRTRRRMPAAA